jgi:hypothetical protein
VYTGESLYGNAKQNDASIDAEKTKNTFFIEFYVDARVIYPTNANSAFVGNQRCYIICINEEELPGEGGYFDPNFLAGDFLLGA